MSTLYVFLRHISALVYPVRCPVCNKIINVMDGFCNECRNEFVRYNNNKNIKNAKKFIAAFEYDKKIAPAIFIMKNSICGNAPYAFGNEISERIKDVGITADFIIPVPMYRENLKKRGYNQSELIAKNAGRMLDIPVYSDIVLKSRKTAEQKHLSFKERRLNLKDAFYVKDISRVKNKRIIIIDDVCTTGSTLEEITNLLVNSGASEVYCACACKTPDLR